MKKRVITTMAILFALVMQSTVAWAAISGTSPVYLSKKNTPINDNHKPSRAPGKNTLTLSVSLDDETKQLCFEDASGIIYTYYIYDANGNVASQGVLDFSNNDNLQIDLASYPSGIYTLAVEYGGNSYMGTFELF